MNREESWFRERTLEWKEWRARRGVFAAALVLGIAAQYVPGATDLAGSESGITALGALPGRVVVCYFIAAMFGALLLSREEKDPARAFLSALPISRRRILWIKTKILVLAWLIVVAAAALIPPVWTMGRDRLWLSGTMLAAGIPILILAAAVSLHFGSPIVSTAASIIAAPVLWLILVAAANGIPDEDSLSRAVFMMAAIASTALLFAWLMFVYCRTSLLEQEPAARAILGILFIIVALEFLITLFLTNWRDAAFLLFGI